MPSQRSNSIVSNYMTNILAKRSAAEEKGFNTLSPEGVETPAGVAGADLFSREGALTPGMLEPVNTGALKDADNSSLEKMVSGLVSSFEYLSTPGIYDPPEPKNFSQRYFQRLARAQNPYYDQERKARTDEFISNAKIQIAQNVRLLQEEINRRSVDPGMATRIATYNSTLGKGLAEETMAQLKGPEQPTPADIAKQMERNASLIEVGFTAEDLIAGGSAPESARARLNNVEKAVAAEREDKGDDDEPKPPKPLDVVMKFRQAVKALRAESAIREKTEGLYGTEFGPLTPQMTDEEAERKVFTRMAGLGDDYKEILLKYLGYGDNPDGVPSGGGLTRDQVIQSIKEGDATEAAD